MLTTHYFKGNNLNYYNLMYVPTLSLLGLRSRTHFPYSQHCITTRLDHELTLKISRSFGTILYYRSLSHYSRKLKTVGSQKAFRGVFYLRLLTTRAGVCTPLF